MKVVILCGGKGFRMRGDTEYKPKPLVSIGNYPILHHIMRIYSYYGFKDFILCLGIEGFMIEDYFSRLKDETKWNISCVDTGVDTLTAERISKIEPYLESDEEFFLTYGDCLANVNIRDLYAFHKAMGRIVTITAVHPTFPLGIIEAEDGLAKTFKSKHHRMSGMINGGFFVCNRRIFEFLHGYKNFYFEDAPLHTLAENKELAVFEHNDFWYKVDSEKQLEELENIWAKSADWKVWE